GQAEHLHDQHVPTLVRPEVSWIECSSNVDELGHGLNCKGCEQTDFCAHQPKDQIDLDDRCSVARKIESEACPKRSGCTVIEIEQIVLDGVNQRALTFDPISEIANAPEDLCSS